MTNAKAPLKSEAFVVPGYLKSFRDEISGRQQYLELVIETLLKAFDKAVPQLWEKATAAITNAVLETRNLIARYRIVRSSLEAFSEKAGARMVLNFDSRTEMFGVQFSIPPRTILSMDFSLDDFGDFFEWIPAYYNARLNGWEYWNLPR